MPASAGSREVMSEKAVTALLENVFMPKVLQRLYRRSEGLRAHWDSPVMNGFA
jgi:hypothetical protein